MIGFTRTYLSFALFLCSSLCIAEQTLSPCDEFYCSGQLVLFNCDGLESDYVEWGILDTTDNVAGNFSYDNESAIGDIGSITVAGVTIWFNKTSNTSYSAWFIANVSLNGYEIACANYDYTDIANCSISVYSVGVPRNLTYDKSTLSDTSVIVNWDAPEDNTCFQNYSVMILAGGVNVTNVTTLNTSIILNEQYEDVQYCVWVAEQGWYEVSQYASLCITLAVPEAVQDLKVYYPALPPPNQGGEPAIVDVTVTWKQPESTRPEVLQYFVTHNVTHPEETSGDYDVSGEEPDPSMLVKETIIVNDTWTTLDGAREGWTYYVEIVPENCLGNGTAKSTLFTITRDLMPTTSTSSSTQAPSSSTIPSVSPSPSPTEEDDGKDGLSTGAIIGIAVGGAVGLAIIVACIIFALCCCICICCNSGKHPDEFEMHGTKL